MKNLFMKPDFFGFKTFLFLIFFLNYLISGAQNMICGTPKFELPSGGNFFPASCSYPDYDGREIFIPVVVHNFSGRNITGDIRAAVSVASSVLLYDKNGNEFKQKIRLVMANKDIDGSCFNGVKDYPVAILGTFSNLNNFVQQNLTNGTADVYKQRYLNIIVSHITGYSGFAPFPTLPDYPAVVLNSDFVLTESFFQVGRGLAHEFGHFCNLIHTHTEYGDSPCPQDECGGDMVKSTNPGPIIRQYIAGEPPYLDLSCDDHNLCNNAEKPFDARNVMTYYCQQYFEQEQMNRLTENLDIYRSHLFTLDNFNLTFQSTLNETLEGEQTFANISLSNKTYYVKEGATLFIEGNVDMTGCSFQMGWGTKVILKENAHLTLSGTSFNSQCERTVWEGITVENNARMETSNACTIAGANIGLHAKYGSTIYINQTNFLDNTYCIKLGENGGNGNVDNWISNCTFKGLFYPGPRTENPYEFASVQIAIDAHQCGVLTVVGNNVFEKCRTAVSSLNTIAYVGVKNDVKECFNGFIVKNNKKTPAYFWDNTVRAKLIGIDVSNANIYVYNNDLYVNNDVQQNPDSPSKCMNIISCVPLEFSPIGVEGVNSNVLETRNLTDYIIYSGWNTRVGFSNNEAAFTGQVRVLYGFQSDFIDNEELYCESLQLRLNTASTYHNNITGGLISDGCRRNIYTENLFYGASNIKSSSAGTYRCNNFSSESEINYNCLGSNFQSNEFAFEFDLKGSGTMISPQINKGNTFYNSTGRYFTDLNLLDNNRFIVKNQLPYYPGTINGPEDWFVPNGDNMQPECQPTNGIPTWGGDGYTKCLDSLFMGTKYSKLSSRQKWIMLFNLYRIYTLNGKKMPLSLSLCAKSILQTYKTKDIGKLADIYDKIDSLRGLKPEGNATMQLTAASDGLYTLINTPATTLTEFKAQASVIKNKFISQQSERIAYDNAYTTLKTEILAEVGAIRSLAVEEPAIHLVELIPMLIASIDDNDAYFDAARMDYLSDVASLCDNDAGEAKYIAASIYEKITGIDVLRDEVGCTTELRSQPNITKNNQIKIYPNPASDHITIESSTTCSVDIYHITGQQVLSTQLTPSGQIDISGLKDGVYIVRCNGTDGTSAVSKIIKQ